jgi:hypothetical protein
MSSSDLAHRDNPNYGAGQTEIDDPKKNSKGSQFLLTSLDHENKDTPKVKKRKVCIKL